VNILADIDMYEVLKKNKEVRKERKSRSASRADKPCDRPPSLKVNNGGSGPYISWFTALYTE
jgi:hypothetical protein